MYHSAMPLFLSLAGVKVTGPNLAKTAIICLEMLPDLSNVTGGLSLGKKPNRRLLLNFLVLLVYKCLVTSGYIPDPL